MADNTAQEILEVEEKPEENQEDTRVVPISSGRLSQIRHNISKLKMLKDISKELRDYKEACTEINTLIGELNDIKGGQEST